MSRRANFQRHRKADARGRGHGFGRAADVVALGQRDAVTRQRRIEGGGRQLARWGGRRRRRAAAPARGVEPQPVERADGRLDPLQEREAGRRLRGEVIVTHLMDHAAESDDRLVGFGQQLSQRGHVAPGIRLARHGRGPGHHVDVGIARRRGADFSRHFDGRWNADVERIFRRDAFLHQGQERGLGRVREVGHGGAFGLGIIVKEVDRAARGGDEADARSLRQPSALERERGFDEIVERAVIDDAVTLAHGEIGGIIAGDGAGVRLRGGLRLRSRAGLDGEDRLAHGKRAAGGMHESLGPADAFDEQHDLARRGIVDDEIEVVGKPEVGLVARRDAVGVAQPALRGGFHPELDGAAGLEDAGDRAGREPAQFGVGIAEQSLAIGIGAHAVRPGDAQAARRHEILEPRATRLRFRLFAIAHHGGIDRGGLDPACFRVGEHGGSRRRRHDHQCMVDRLGQIAQRWKAALAIDLLLPRIDERNASRIAELAQVLENFARPARALGCTHDGKRFRLQRADGRTE